MGKGVISDEHPLCVAAARSRYIQCVPSVIQAQCVHNHIPRGYLLPIPPPPSHERGAGLLIPLTCPILTSYSERVLEPSSLPC